MTPGVERRYYRTQQALAAGFLIAGCFSLLVSLHRTPTPNQEVSTQSHSAQSPSAPSLAASPAVATDRLIVSALGINAPVAHLGVARDGTIAVPDNLWQVSLFNQYQTPGQVGNAIIDGHTGAPGQIGVFRNLPKLAVGDLVTYQQASGLQYSYKVTSLASYRVNDPAVKADIYAPTSQARLHLITCDGVWTARTYSYARRLVVDAILVSS